MSSLKLIVLSCLLLVGCSSKPRQPSPKIPNEIKVNTVGLKKKLIFNDCVRGTIKNIQKIEWRGNNYFAVIGQTGVWFLSPTEYQVTRKIEYTDAKGETIWFGLSPYLIDLDNDGEFEIAQRGGGYGVIGLLDNTGKRIWEFKPNLLVHPYKMAVEDLNNDKDYEFYVADDGYLYCLNESCKVVWKKPGRYSDIHPITLNGKRLVITSSKDTFKIWDINGNQIQKIRVNAWILEFDVIDNAGETFLIRVNDDKLKIFNLTGIKLFEDELPFGLGYHGPQGIIIDSKNSKKKLLAVVTRSSTATGKALLNIYDVSEWKLVYQEVLETTEGINSNNGRLLLGDGKEKLWEYYF